MLNLMYITNNPEIAKIAEENGVDRIWIDLETKGKKERQGEGTWISNHSISDIVKVKNVLSKSMIVVRVNPWNEKSEDEINSVIDAGADIIMLPMWRTSSEVEKFYNSVDNRVRTILLLETRDAENCLSEVIQKRPEEIHIGLRDLSLSYGFPSIFDLYTNGIIERISNRLRRSDIKFGIGGIGKFGVGLRPGPECILLENIRLGSSAVILSRTFQNFTDVSVEEVEKGFSDGIRELKKWYYYSSIMPEEMFLFNKKILDMELNRK